MPQKTYTVRPQDVAGRTFLITGANTGIGKVTAVEIARAGGQVLLAGRSKERTQEVLDTIAALPGAPTPEFFPLDLGSLEDVRRCADAILQRPGPIHVLINNAGLAGLKGLTADGFEMAFGVNHLGHFLFTLLLLPKLREAQDARIVTVASRAHTRTKTFDLDAVQQPTATTSGFPEYQISKLANVLFSAELARKLDKSGIRTYSLHPGVVASDVWREVPWPFRSLMKLWMITNEEGAATSLYCATSPEVAHQTGLYYDKLRPIPTAPLGADPRLAAELWRRSLAWTGAPDITP